MFLVVGVAVAVVLDFMTLIPVKLSSTISLRNVSFQWKFFTQQRVGDPCNFIKFQLNHFHVKHFRIKTPLGYQEKKGRLALFCILYIIYIICTH